MKMIADLQCALDNHKQMISQRDQELEEAFIQISAMKDLDKHKNQDFEQIKQELYDVSSAYNNLKEDNIVLESQVFFFFGKILFQLNKDQEIRRRKSVCGKRNRKITSFG